MQKDLEDLKFEKNEDLKDINLWKIWWVERNKIC